MSENELHQPAVDPEKIRSGDVQEWTTLFSAVNSANVRVGGHRFNAGDRTRDGEDVAQDAMLRLWTRRATLPDYVADRAYQTRVTTNTAFSRGRPQSYRSQHERVGLDYEISPEGYYHDIPDTSDFATEIVDGITVQRVGDVVKELPDRNRDVLELRVQGLSYREIGDMVGLSEADAKKTMFRTRVRLLDELELDKSENVVNVLYQRVSVSDE
jgi:RNA polymerase sigma factor (sigma-70 family)